MLAIPDDLGTGAQKLWFEVPLDFKMKDENPANADPASAGYWLGCGNDLPDFAAAAAKTSPKLRKYLSEIQKKLNEHMVYPLDASTLRRDGRAVVCIQINRDGSIPVARVLNSSGQPQFDGLALMATGMTGLDGNIGPFPAEVPSSRTSMELVFPVDWSF